MRLVTRISKYTKLKIFNGNVCCPVNSSFIRLAMDHSRKGNPFVVEEKMSNPRMKLLSRERHSSFSTPITISKAYDVLAERASLQLNAGEGAHGTSWLFTLTPGTHHLLHVSAVSLPLTKNTLHLLLVCTPNMTWCVCTCVPQRVAADPPVSEHHPTGEGESLQGHRGTTSCPPGQDQCQEYYIGTTIYRQSISALFLMPSLKPILATHFSLSSAT